MSLNIPETTSKAVVIMYPDSRTTGVKADLMDNYNDTSIAHFSHVVEHVLNRYLNKGFSLIAVIYQDTDQTTWSPVYNRGLFTKEVALPVTHPQWTRAAHRHNLEQILPKFGLHDQSEVVTGGYHALDCVALMTKVLQEAGHQASPNFLLTNELGPLIVSHRIRRQLGRNYLNIDRKEDQLTWFNLRVKFQKVLTAL